jgi:F-type H+-transporting ATPase subunit delta
VAEVVSDRVDERMNRTAAQVTSAQPMPDDQRARVEESLAQFSGKTVRATYETDPALIGGLTAVIGGRVIDGSLRTRLARIKEALIGQEIEVE